MRLCGLNTGEFGKRRKAAAARTWTLVRAEDGAAAMEFVIVLPILLTLLFGIIQFGALLFIQNNMQNAAREAAREYAVGILTTAAQTQTFAENYLAGWGMTFNVAVSVPGTLPPPDDEDVTVTITVPAAQAAMVGFPPLWGGTTLSVFATFREEG